METLAHIIGNQISQLLEEREIKPVELARALGLKEPQVSRIRKGTRKPSFEVLCAAADYFNVSTDYLLGREQGGI